MHAAMLETIAEFLIVGLVIGGIYALFAIGITLIFGVLDVINTAHGEFFAIGGYLAFLGIVTLQMHPFLGVVAAVAGSFALGLALYPLLIAPLRNRLGRRPSGPTFLVLTLGLSTFLQSMLVAIAGGDYLRVPPYVRGMLDLQFTAVSHQRILIFIVATLTLAALFAFLRWHRQGMAIRAVAMNPDAAQSVGVNLALVFTLTLALGVGLAGLAGALIAPVFSVYPAVGFALTIKAFAITILGGMGNVMGALVASFFIAVVEALAVIWIPSEWQNMIAFAVMVIVLLVRPQGLFGRPLAQADRG
ncbi:MAG: branched-chain amino acid ABC transporter permease [Acidimicrobiia bacterium]